MGLRIGRQAHSHERGGLASSTGQGTVVSQGERAGANVLVDAYSEEVPMAPIGSKHTRGAPMVDDDPDVIGSAAWMERDQFVYFVTMARELGNPSDWQSFRDELVSALRAAWGIDALWLHLDAEAQRDRRAGRIALAYELVDETRTHHDPATSWDAFVESLWSSRAPLTGAA